MNITIMFYDFQNCAIIKNCKGVIFMKNSKILEINSNRKYELELLIKNGINIALEELFKTYSIEEINYLRRSFLIPLDIMSQYVDFYDANTKGLKPNIDELKFVHELAQRFNTDRSKVIRRIQDVRQIRRVCLEKKAPSTVPSNDSEVVADLLDSFEYDSSKTGEVLLKYENINGELVKKIKPPQK